MLFAICHEPWRPREQSHLTAKNVSRVGSERRLHDRAFRFVEHEAVVDEANSALNIVEPMAGESASGGLHEQEAKTCPRINGDAAVMQIRDDLVKLASAYLSNRLRMDEDVGSQRTV